MKKALMAATTASMIDNFNKENIRILKELGYEVTLACGFGEGNTESEERVSRFMREMLKAGVGCVDIRFPRSPYRIGEMASSYRKLKKLIEREDYELIHCHTPVGGFLTRLAAGAPRREGKLKVIYTAHGFHFYKGAPLRNWILYYPAERLCSYLTDVLITINHEDCELAERKMRAERTEYVPGVGVDTERFKTAGRFRKEKREDYGISQDSIVLLSAGELIKRKNHAVILEALAMMQGDEAFPEIKYLICGIGALKKELEEKAEGLGIGDKVRFMGYTEDMPGICGMSDIFIFPSLQEGLPVALMEAMAAGLPVICSDIRGNADLIRDGENGLTVGENKPEAYADAIRTMINDGDLRRRLADKAGEDIKKYDIRNVSAKMRDIYREVSFGSEIIK